MIEIITTGGTIDKVYFDKKSDYQVGDPFIGDLLTKMNVNIDYKISPLMRVDSLDMDDGDREKILNHILKSNYDKILITHGTDTIVDTAIYLNQLNNKTVVLTGSLKPALFIDNDAIFNIGCAFTSVQNLSKGVYIIMNGQVFEPNNCRKNIEKNIFENVKIDINFSSGEMFDGGRPNMVFSYVDGKFYYSGVFSDKIWSVYAECTTF